MSTRYPGGFISRSAPVIVGPTNGEGGSAPGVWTLEQASYYTKQGTWPQRIKDRLLFSWGDNKYGQLGQNDNVYRSSPVQVGSQTNWSSVFTGITGDPDKGISVAIKTDGTLWAWGSNGAGQLGQNNTIYRSSPVQVGALTTWSSSAAGYKFTIFKKTDGTLYSTGDNAYGQLGQNNLVNKSNPTQIGSGSTWLNISCGQYHVAATKTDGTLWTWGANSLGQLGQNNVIYRSSPVQVGSLTTWSNIAGGSVYTIATKTDGTLWSWGYNVYGQLGQNNTIYRSSPVQVGALTTWSKIACSAATSLALKTDGTLWAWGFNGVGGVGDNTTIRRSSPVQVGSLATWKNVFCGGDLSAAALKNDGTLWVWGYNTKGQLGNNSTANVSSPIQVGSSTNWIAASFSGDSIIGIQAV